MAQYPKMYRGGVQITTLNRSGVSLNDANRSGYRIFHKHTSSCYSAGHTHTESCYKICGGRLITPYGTHYAHECSVCGKVSYNSYAADEDATPGDYCNKHGTCDAKILICGKEEGSSTLICGYEV